MDEIHELVTRARASQTDTAPRQAAFNGLVKRYQNMVYGCAYAVLRDFHQAEDVAQESFIDAYLNLDKLENPKAFPGWLRRIVIG
jgi:DNA-directed RNA polymerase specialized sigma24 family protein